MIKSYEQQFKKYKSILQTIDKSKNFLFDQFGERMKAPLSL